MDGVTPGRKAPPPSSTTHTKKTPPKAEETLGLRGDSSPVPSKSLLERSPSVSGAGARNPVLVKVEKEIIAIWEKRLSETQDPAVQEELMNLPVDNRRHMLSFAAFNGMPEAARWAEANGAKINIGDYSNSTMLKMAAANKNPEMIEVALELGGDPDLVSGISHGQMTLLSSMLAYKEDKDDAFMQVLVMAKQYGAGVKDEEERLKLIDKLAEVETRLSGSHDFQGLKDYLKGAPIRPNQVSIKLSAAATSSHISDEVDKHLAQQIRDKKLTKEECEQFMATNKNFSGFLLFNGLSETLGAYIELLSPEELQGLMEDWDAEGNNFMFSAIKSREAETVQVALKHWSGDINAVCPDLPGFYAYNPGATAIGIAMMWGADTDMLKGLIAKGADPDVPCGSYPNLRDKVGSNRTAYDLIDDRVTLGRTKPDWAETLKGIVKQARDEYLQSH